MNIKITKKEWSAVSDAILTLIERVDCSYSVEGAPAEEEKAMKLLESWIRSTNEEIHGSPEWAKSAKAAAKAAKDYIAHEVKKKKS